ncbi:MAG TPA: cation:proton antiporter [Longimicrobiaceae bacterium]|nr:cation:proton antiporter [Longimicrobiaceae bacterium]
MHPLLAFVGAPPFFVEVAALIVAGAAIAYVSARLGLVPIVGFLLAGVLIGPHALGLVGQELVDGAAEVGVILLLFTIGIEFSLEKLARIRRLILGGGALQVGLATAATAGILAALGVDWRAGVFTGFLVSLSSTAIVLKLLADRGETTAPHGEVGLALLIFQDVAIIAMVLLVPMLGGAGGGAGEVALTLGRAAAIIVVVLFAARRLMPWVLEAVAKTCSPEIFLLSVIAVCFGTAYLTSLAGVSLSLGAFLAGLLVSESRFSEHALGEILPLQILFSATFFVSVGMLLDLGFLMGNLPLVAAVVAGVLLVKAVTTAASVAALGYRVPVAAASGLMLAQVGEFSFVLERAGREVGLAPAGLAEGGSQAFIATTVVLMVLTPFLTQAGARLARGLEARHAAAGAPAETDEPPAHIPRLENHVVVAGYGDAARRLSRVLRDSGVPFLVTTLNPGGANEAEEEGVVVLRGDSSRQRTLLHVGADRAKVLVVADDDPAMAVRIVSVARSLNPTLRVVVRTRYISEAEPLRAAGADTVIAEEMESIVQLFGTVLGEYAISVEAVAEYERAIRGAGYAQLRDGGHGGASPADPAPIAACELGPDCFGLRTVTVREGAAAAGHTPGELGLGPRFGIELRELRRDGTRVAAPGPEAALRPGDELVLSGSADAFRQAADLFRADADGSGDATDGARPTGGAAVQALELFPRADASACSHLGGIRSVFPRTPAGCEECLARGDSWVHLRVCMTCGHVGCCDSSPNRHATAHFHGTRHPVMRSFERGEDWGWCYVDEVTL